MAAVDMRVRSAGGAPPARRMHRSWRGGKPRMIHTPSLSRALRATGPDLMGGARATSTAKSGSDAA